MNLINEFEDSPMLKFVYQNISYFLDNPIRRLFNDPVKKVKAAGIRSGMNVLEVGCGSGYFTLSAAKLVGDEGCLHAIDIHHVAIETVSKKIKEVNLKNVILSQTDALETGLPCESYDLILLFGVIPSPVLPLKRLIPEMHRLLKPGGIMAVWTALPLWSPKSITEHGLFSYISNKDGVHIYTRARERRKEE
jgi:demethylmenaquinone methyltransferase/2-methoxy-6-polyprenyl-1,4-benzoquinol methylase